MNICSNQKFPIQWAKKLLEDKKDWVILDTETTGLYKAEIVQIGIINLSDQVLLATKVQPTIIIPPDVIAIHGITNEAVKNAPTFPKIYPLIVETLKNKKVAIYNARFDIGILNYCCDLHNLPSLELEKRSCCIMERYAEYYGQWSEYYGSYKWQPLRGGDHSAIGDCRAAIALIKEMAET